MFLLYLCFYKHPKMKIIIPICKDTVVLRGGGNCPPCIYLAYMYNFIDTTTEYTTITRMYTMFILIK